MSIELRQLIIRAVVQPDDAGGSKSAASASAGDNDVKPQEEMMNKCIDKITEILQQRNER